MTARVKPSSQAELIEAVQDAMADKTPLELIGTGTKRGLGRPMQTAATLDLSGFSEITLYEPDELVITAGAGAKLDDIRKLAESKGQELAFEPPDLSHLLGSAHSGTLGGMLACNLSGPRRIKAGACRDFVLGMSGVSGRGDAFKAGGRVMKNVTGYDVPKLMAGSYGTLAALMSVTFKTMPKPETEETLVLEGLGDDGAIRAMSLAMQSSCEVSGAAHIPAALAGGKAVTLLRLEGLPPSIAYRRDKLAGLLTELAPQNVLSEKASIAQWLAIRDVLPLTNGRNDRLVWRLSVPPSDGAEAASAISRQIDARWFYDWAGGLIWLDVPANETASAAIIRSVVTQGHTMLVRAPENIRVSVEVFQPQDAPLAALGRRVKDSFDPIGIFNPRRMRAEF